MSDLLCQLFVLIKFNHNLIIHNSVYSPNKYMNKYEKYFTVFFRKEDNSDFFILTLIADEKNNLLNLDFLNKNLNNLLNDKITQKKTIYLWKSISSDTFGETFACRTVKSSVEFLEQLVKYI
jgi:hypothetical protein